MSLSPWRLREAARSLRAGGVIAYPTESVWGLGCDPANPAALRRLQRAKKRESGKGFILVAADHIQVRPYIEVQAEEFLRVQMGHAARPVTWILPACKKYRGILTGYRGTVAVRITQFAVIADLCRAFDGAITSTSANLSGRPAATTELAARRAIGSRRGGVDLFCPGSVGGYPGASEIRVAATGRIVRAQEPIGLDRFQPNSVEFDKAR